MQKYNQLYKFFIVLLVSGIITSCVTETIETTPGMKFSETAIISVQDPYSKIKKGSTIAWLPDAVLFYKDERMKNAQVKGILEEGIIHNLRAKNLHVVESVNGSKYAIAYTAALESALDDTAIIRRFGLLPGNAQIPKDDANVEKGALIVYIFDNQNNEVVWRSAAQVGVRFDMSMEERKERVTQILAEMFQSLDVVE